MSDVERDLFWEMVRTIKLLGGKEDIVGILGIMDLEIPQQEAVEETQKLVKCWNDNVEKQLTEITENPLYRTVNEYPCNNDWGQ